MPQSIAHLAEESTSTLLDSITDPIHLDRSVQDTLDLLLGASITAEDLPASDITTVTLTAVIGLAGALSGAYTILVPAPAALRMTTAMLGLEATSVDETVLDCLGEITNILAGSWKSGLPALNSACLLSVPTVVIGTQYEIHKRASAFHLTRSYRYEGHVFAVSIHGENP